MATMFEHLGSLDQEKQWVPKDFDYFILEEIRKETIRKQKEWEFTKNRLEDKMLDYMEKIRRQIENDSKQ